MAKRTTKIIILSLVAVLAFSASGKRRQKIAPSYAWSILPPLGLREPATIDTLYENYSLEFIPQLQSDAYAATGNYCAEGQTQLFFQREPMSEFYFKDPLMHWLPSESTARFYNTRIPMTLMSYNFGGGKDNGQDRFTTVFSGNANSKVQVGALIDYIYSKGSYNYQAAKDLTWGFSGSYISNRYEFQGYFFHYNLLNKENGGITDDRYITDPAEVQGGSTSVNPKNIPTNLSAAHNRTSGGEIYLNNRYKLGFYEETVINDSTTVKTLVPVTSFIWTLKYTEGKHRFMNTNATENVEFWDNTYFNPAETQDRQTYWKLRNTVGVSLLEGFNKYAKAGLSAYATYEIRNYDMISLSPEVEEGEEPSTEGLTPNPYPGMRTSEKESLLWVGAQLTKQQGRILNYDVTGEIGLLGAAVGEVKVNGEVTTRVPLLGDTVGVTAFGKFTNLTAPWLMKHYLSNHYIWENDFSKTRSLRLGGELTVPWTNTRLSAGVENVQNLIYFNEQALPTQNGGSVQVFNASLVQNFKFGIFHWDNRVTYQTTSDEVSLPLPNLVVNSNMYINFRVATLFVQLGIDCDYFTKYKGVAYQPATMAFYNQRTVDIGNYPFMSVYVNCKLSKTRFYLMMSHVNQGLTGTNYFSMPGYPMNPRRFQLGFSIDFAN